MFAGLEQLGGKVVRALTQAHNELAITLKRVAYNVKRLVWLVEHEPAHSAPPPEARCAYGANQTGAWAPGVLDSPAHIGCGDLN